MIAAIESPLEALSLPKVATSGRPIDRLNLPIPIARPVKEPVE